MLDIKRESAAQKRRLWPSYAHGTQWKEIMQETGGVIEIYNFVFSYIWEVLIKQEYTTMEKEQSRLKQQKSTNLYTPLVHKI